MRKIIFFKILSGVLLLLAICAPLYHLANRDYLQMIQINLHKAQLQTWKQNIERPLVEDRDPKQLQAHMQSLVFLEKEIDVLCQSSTKTDSEQMKRTQFLTDGSNRLSFVSRPLAQTASSKETELSLTRPVEMDTQDLRLLLSLIENEKAIGLRFKHFELKRKTLPLEEEVYLINFNLIATEKL